MDPTLPPSSSHGTGLQHPPEVAHCAEQLVAWFGLDRQYAVAFSGGVDSAVVAQAALLSGARVLAVTARSPSVAGQERMDVERVLQAVPLPHYWLDTTETQSAEYQRNDQRRCYYCKTHLFAAIGQRFPDAQIVTGTNADDLSDYRPGLVAAAESHVRAPLAELGIGKALVRQLAHYWQLPIADKPASPCLASRIAHGVSVTEQRLRMIERAEAFLRDWGLREFRVRLHAEELARIEVPLEWLVLLTDAEHRGQLTEHFRALGFRFVTLDLQGFRSGSLNPLIQITPSV